MKLTSTKTLIVILVIIIVFLLAVISYGVYEIRSRNLDTSELLNEVDQLAEAKEMTRAIKAIRMTALDDIDTFNSLVLTSDKLVPLIESLEKKGRELGVEVNIVSVNKGEESQTPSPNIISMVIEAEGSWAGSYSFLKTIESLPYNVMIKESILSKAMDKWLLRATVVLNLFD